MMTPSIRVDTLSYSQIWTFDFWMEQKKKKKEGKKESVRFEWDDRDKEGGEGDATDWRCLKMMLMGWTITR